VKSFGVERVVKAIFVDFRFAVDFALGNKVISGSKRWRQKPKQGYELAILSN